MCMKPMVDPGWGIWANSPPPPPHLEEEPAILLIKILNFVRPRSVYKTYENIAMHILLAQLYKFT